MLTSKLGPIASACIIVGLASPIACSSDSSGGLESGELTHEPGAVGSSTPADASSSSSSPSPSSSSNSSAPSPNQPNGTGGTAQDAGPVLLGGPGCGLANAAFCATFDAPKNTNTRTGDLDEVLWGVSRVGGINPGAALNDIPNISMTGCGPTNFVFAPKDVRICNGRLFETVNDGGAVVNLDMYPKQPFNFSNRTGTIVFDVSADSEGSHAAWPELLITDKPVPGARVSISGGVPAGAANEIGITFDGCATGTGVGRIYVMRNYAYEEVSFTPQGCVTKGSLTSLNHFEVRLSQDKVEILGTDPGGGPLKPLATADHLGLTFTQGLVWMNDVHYNARKAIEPGERGTQFNHTFAWDNLGFDGPKTYRDLGFDVPDVLTPGQPSSFAGDPTVRTGYQVSAAGTDLPISGVRWEQTPTSAIVVLNTYSFDTTIPSVRINGGPWISTPWPFDKNGYGWRSIAIPIPNAQYGTGAGQIHTGANTISFKSPDWSTTVANVSLILVAAAAVP